MKKIVIYGAVFLDVIKLIDAINNKEPQWEVVGFIDEDNKIFKKQLLGYPVLGNKDTIPDLADNKDLHFIVNRHDEINKFIEKVRFLESYNCNMTSLIHPEIDMKYVKVGKGCIIPDGCVIGANVEIDDYVIMRYGGVISHDVKAEKYVFMAPGVTIGSNVTLEEGCFIGIGSTVLPKVTIGKKSYIGGGSVVTRNINEKNLVVGVPAKKIKKSIFKRLRCQINKKLELLREIIPGF